MTLYGRRIVVTRATHQSEEIIGLLRDAGGIPVCYPCIDIAPSENPGALESALSNLSEYDWIIFSSSNTVRALQRHILEKQPGIDWTKIKIAAVGTKTGDAILQTFKRYADFIPEIQTGEALAESIPLNPGDKIVLPQSALADDKLASLLSKKGATVTLVEAYRNVIGTGGEDVPALLSQNQIDAITFTSGSTVTNFVIRITPVEAFDIPAICIGSSTYQVAVEAGFQKVYYPENYTIPDMIELLESHFDEVKHGDT